MDGFINAIHTHYVLRFRCHDDRRGVRHMMTIEPAVYVCTFVSVRLSRPAVVIVVGDTVRHLPTRFSVVADKPRDAVR